MTEKTIENVTDVQNSVEELDARVKAATEKTAEGISQVEALVNIALQRILPDEAMNQEDVKEDIRAAGVKTLLPLSMIVYLAKIGGSIVNAEQREKTSTESSEATTDVEQD